MTCDLCAHRDGTWRLGADDQRHPCTCNLPAGHDGGHRYLGLAPTQETNMASTNSTASPHTHRQTQTSEIPSTRVVAMGEIATLLDDRDDAAALGIDHLVTARQMSLKTRPLIRDISPTLNALADVQRRMDRYGAPTTRTIDRELVRASVADLCRHAQDIAARAEQMSDVSLVEQLDNLAAIVGEISRVAKGGQR